MKVSKSWLKELVDKVSIKEVERLLPLRTIGTKEITEDFIELDMKGYNRADLLSMRGIAKEVAAITGSALVGREPLTYEVYSNKIPTTPVKVEDEKLCPVYCIAKIEGLKSGPSKSEWIKKLNDSGMRTVNNIADITNLIMLEFGQPMHSFDAEKITDETLVVRLASQGETLQTLDGKNRKLDESDLLIADSEKPLGIAGVMGGKESETSDTTTIIFLEAAIFDPKSIRKSVQRHSLPSEASKRFQHGLTKTNLLKALSAAIKMYEELGGKLTAITLTGDLEDKIKKITLTQEKVNELIGIDISPKVIEDSLKSLGFILVSKGDSLGAWEVSVPYWRLDIDIEEDLIEEVARMFGYEKIPAKELKGEIPQKIDQSLFEFIYKLKSALAEAGLTEVQTYSFSSTKVLDALGFDESNKDAIVKIANPISSETEYLREFIWPNLVEVIEKNMKQDFTDIAIFEIGKVYLSQKKGSPKESYRLAMALMNGTDNPIEELIHIVKNTLSVIPNVSEESLDSNHEISRSTRNDKNDGLPIEKGELMKELETLFHPKRYANIKTGDKIIGGVAEVHPRFLNNFGIEKRVAILEISLDSLI